MEKLKTIGKYTFFAGVIGIGVTFDAIGAGGVVQWIDSLGLSDGMMLAAIAYLVWENKNKLTLLDNKIDKIEDKIDRWDRK